MQLSSYLKQFKNIAWYPSAFKDSLSMMCLSYKSLKQYGISKSEVPDCFIFTDYTSYMDQSINFRFFLDLEDDKDEASFSYNGVDYSATAYNIKELDKLDISFDKSLVAFDKDKYYGRVFIADILLEHPRLGKSITKLVYIIVENTSFAFDYLIKKGIKVKYVIHCRYGHGFGGGISNGGFMCHILEELGTKYFASDIDNHYQFDIADKYLTGIKRNTLPILEEIDNFKYSYDWCGYNDVVLYEVLGYKLLETNPDYKRYLKK